MKIYPGIPIAIQYTVWLIALVMMVMSAVDGNVAVQLHADAAAAFTVPLKWVTIFSSIVSRSTAPVATPPAMTDLPKTTFLFPKYVCDSFVFVIPMLNASLAWNAYGHPVHGVVVIRGYDGDVVGAREIFVCGASGC